MLMLSQLGGLVPCIVSFTQATDMFGVPRQSMLSFVPLPSLSELDSMD